VISRTQVLFIGRSIVAKRTACLLKGMHALQRFPAGFGVCHADETQFEAVTLPPKCLAGIEKCRVIFSALQGSHAKNHWKTGGACEDGICFGCIDSQGKGCHFGGLRNSQPPPPVDEGIA
jgi:hypothetical protein